MKVGILWDLDGTLLDTLEDLADGVNHALREFGYPERTIEEVRGSGEYSSLKVVNQKSIYFSMEVLFRVDKMLWTNLYHRGQTPPVESLLYHNFLLDRKDLLYSGKYKEWCADHDFDQIIEFQESVKKDLREERKKELTGNR